MDITPRTARRISTIAWAGAAFGTVFGQVHALARIQEHPGDLVDAPLTKTWSEPATRALRPLLDWSDPNTVYLTWGKIWLPICVAFTLAAFLVHHRRAPRGAEKWLWRVALGGYVLMTLSVVGDYFSPWMDAMFVAGIGAMLAIGIGGIPFGILLLRNGFHPRVTAVLLMIFMPFLFAITSVTSLGSALLPLMWGWAIAAHAVVRQDALGEAGAGAHALVQRT